MTTSAIPGLRTDAGRLLIRCADRPGIVRVISTALADRGLNIVQSDQFSTMDEEDEAQFFMRVVFERNELAEKFIALRQDLVQTLGTELDAWIQVSDASKPKRVALFVSRLDHCLVDLLWRHRRGLLPIDVRLVISNHDDLRYEVESHGIRFEHVPVTRATKPEAELRHLELLGDDIDFVVLARYMQILSGSFLHKLERPIINIHHSALPAFAGAGPYERAKKRGVKLVGATAHYVTEELDEGPIITQGVRAVTHVHSKDDLVRAGADVERAMLLEAVTAHAEDRVIVYGNTTIVF